MYFITIATQRRKCNLGHINPEHQMILSDYGEIVQTEWNRSFDIRRELSCDEFTIMPNHLHAIITILHPSDVDELVGADFQVQPHDRAALSDGMAVPSPSEIKLNRPVRMPKSISSFLAGFKSAVNSKIDDYIDENHLNIPKYNRNNHFFQPNYHDHIIRNEIEYHFIKNYIINNPRKWNEDRFKK